MLETEALLTVMQQGSLSLQGEFIWGSNYTFLTSVTFEDKSFEVVYKPSDGERPLWDFPSASLAHREVAAFLVSEALDWSLVPPTAYVHNGPYGPGSIQMFIDHDPEYHYFNFKPEHRRMLDRVAVFDILVNNADRKGSHVLVDRENHLWLIDHGLCFHVDGKLRTVIWDFEAQAISEGILLDIEALRVKLESGSNLVSILEPHLTHSEIRALALRVEHLTKEGKYPKHATDVRQYPWPLL